MSSKTSKPVPPTPLTAAPPHKTAEHAEEQKRDEPPPPKDLDPPPLTGRALDEHIAARAAGELNQGAVDPGPRLNLGAVHPGPLEPPHAKARLHMDQIDAVATPQGVVLFALTEGGEIWQLTTFSGQPEWTHILTPEAPAEDA